MIIELILAIFLERNTKKDSNNSSRPSSQTEKDKSALSHLDNGKGKSENKDQAKNTRVKETVTISQVLTCDVYAQDLSNIACIDHERRNKIDIVFEKVVDHKDAEIKRCPACHSAEKSLFPSDSHDTLQSGEGLKAFVINLLVGQVVALNRVQKLAKLMIAR